MTARVELRHLRALNYCARGSRKFFERHGFDWADFLRNGIDPAKFYATGDAMAIKAARLAESQDEGRVATSPGGGAHCGNGSKACGH